MVTEGMIIMVLSPRFYIREEAEISLLPILMNRRIKQTDDFSNRQIINFHVHVGLVNFICAIPSPVLGLKMYKLFCEI